MFLTHCCTVGVGVFWITKVIISDFFFLNLLLFITCLKKKALMFSNSFVTFFFFLFCLSLVLYYSVAGKSLEQWLPKRVLPVPIFTFHGVDGKMHWGSEGKRHPALGIRTSWTKAIFNGASGVSLDTGVMADWKSLKTIGWGGGGREE